MHLLFGAAAQQPLAASGTRRIKQSADRLEMKWCVRVVCIKCDEHVWVDCGRKEFGECRERSLIVNLRHYCFVIEKKI